MKYIVTSDIHLGHSKTPTSHIIASFKKHVLSDANKDADVLFIAGDLFDHLLYMNTKEAQQCISFSHYLLQWCVDNDVTLIILEGTPSHDWYQSSLLPKLNDLREVKAKLHYHKVLDIQYLPEHQKHVLYIPDEWCKDQESLESQISAKLQEHGIEKVDIAILHGQFRYQLNGRPSSAFCYDEAYFLNLVREYIHIGHYHIYSEFDRIIANGSLERLAHGEEQPKGYLVVNNGVKAFIENPDAYTYLTIPVTDRTTQAKLDKIIFGCRKDSHIRLKMKPSCKYNAIFSELKIRYADYNLKKLIKDEGDTSEDITATYITGDDSLEIAENMFLETNIYEALMNAVQAKYQLTQSEQDKLVKYAQVFAVTTPEEV